VLCPKKEDAGVSALVSLDNNYLGLLLPYSPLHEILFRTGNFDALVMTSANMSEEPICHQNEECRQRLGGVADYFLEHNRDIYIRCDDSVMRVSKEQPVFIRRSRGYAPRPILLQQKGTSVRPSRAKNCICLTRDNLPRQPTMATWGVATLQVFEQTIRHMQLFEIDPRQIIHDLHQISIHQMGYGKARIPFTGLQHHLRIY
jgi:hydrogenase maturation protein HypF